MENCVTVMTSYISSKHLLFYLNIPTLFSHAWAVASVQQLKLIHKHKKPKSNQHMVGRYGSTGQVGSEITRPTKLVWGQNRHPQPNPTLVPICFSLPDTSFNLDQ